MVRLQNGACEEVESMNMELSSGEFLYSNLYSFFCVICSWVNWTFILKSRWLTQTLRHAAFHCPGRARKPAVLPSSQSALLGRHVRLAAFDRQPQQLRLPPAGMVGRLQRLLALRTLPRVRRHGGRAKRKQPAGIQQQHPSWAQIQAGGGQRHPPLPRLIGKGLCHMPSRYHSSFTDIWGNNTFKVTATNSVVKYSPYSVTFLKEYDFMNDHIKKMYISDGTWMQHVR